MTLFGPMTHNKNKRLDTTAAAQAIGHVFARPEILAQALIHRSAAGGDVVSYERLEFLGDRVLGLTIAEMLFSRFPKEAEGALAGRHTALVRAEALARVADTIGLGRYLVMARGEEEVGGRTNGGLLADACEAVIGALYLDGGLEVAKAFINRHWEGMMEEDLTPPKDAKTALQEWAQRRALPLPKYETVAAEGPDHSPRFTICVTVEGQPPATATGASKRAAAQAAAQALLEKIT